MDSLNARMSLATMLALIAGRFDGPSLRLPSYRDSHPDPSRVDAAVAKRARKNAFRLKHWQGLR